MLHFCRFLLSHIFKIVLLWLELEACFVATFWMRSGVRIHRETKIICLQIIIFLIYECTTSGADDNSELNVLRE